MKGWDVHGRTPLEAVALDAQSLAEAMLRFDSAYGRIPVEKRTRLASLALCTGRDWALELRRDYPGADPTTLATVLRVKVLFSDMPNESYNTVFRSEYLPEPPTIVVYERSVEALKEVVREAGLSNEVDPECIVPMHVAHELFHHLEKVGRRPVSKLFKVTTLRLGPWRLVSGVRMLSEISAHAFAQRLISVRWYPFALDMVESMVRGGDGSPVELWDRAVKGRLAVEYPGKTTGGWICEKVECKWRPMC